MRIPKIFAHRGASSDAPENTLPAFKLAIEQGADGVEFDVHLTSDKIPVVIHDESADRTGTLGGLIVQRTFDQWMESDFGIWKKSSFTGTRLPSLSEVLELLKPWHGHINIELKTDTCRYDGIEEIVLGLIEKSGMKDRIVISSFQHESLAICNNLDSGLRLAALLGHKQKHNLATLKRMGVSDIHPDFRDATGANVKRWHEEGFMVRPWTINSRLIGLWQARNGADAIITNRPAIMKSFLLNFCETTA